jgi:isopenicillin-N epimerase
MRPRKTGAQQVTRRQFARMAASVGAAAVVMPVAGWHHPDPLPATPAAPDERFWKSVRDQFLLPADLALLNAANLCPSSAPVLQVFYDNIREIDRDPSMQNRQKITAGREATRRELAACLRATPEEIVITRNTSEGNNIVSSGLDLKPGDEVIIVSDNHPSLHAAWREKAKRFGFVVKVVDQVNPHPGPQYYLDAFAKQATARTKVIAFSHVTASVGDLFPARELCRFARERGILSIVDAAQSFGLLDIDLADMQPDIFTGSAHKWPCGPRENGVLFINKSAQSRLAPSIISLYAGAVGVSRTFEAMGQRDEPAMVGFGEALRFQAKIGRAVIEARGRELARALVEGLKTMPGVKIWTSADPAASAAIVTFLPGDADPNKLAAVLYEKEKIACMARAGADRPGLRLSPHFYNLHDEIDRTLAGIKKHMATT